MRWLIVAVLLAGCVQPGPLKVDGWTATESLPDARAWEPWASAVDLGDGWILTHDGTIIDLDRGVTLQATGFAGTSAREIWHAGTFALVAVPAAHPFDHAGLVQAVLRDGSIREIAARGVVVDARNDAALIVTSDGDDYIVSRWTLDGIETMARAPVASAYPPVGALTADGAIVVKHTPNNDWQRFELEATRIGADAWTLRIPDAYGIVSMVATDRGFEASTSSAARCQCDGTPRNQMMHVEVPHVTFTDAPHHIARLVAIDGEALDASAVIAQVADPGSATAEPPLRATHWDRERDEFAFHHDGRWWRAPRGTDAPRESSFLVTG